MIFPKVPIRGMNGVMPPFPLYRGKPHALAARPNFWGGGRFFWHMAVCNDAAIMQSGRTPTFRTWKDPDRQSPDHWLGSSRLLPPRHHPHLFSFLAISSSQERRDLRPWLSWWSGRPLMCASAISRSLVSIRSGRVLRTTGGDVVRESVVGCGQQTINSGARSNDFSS